MRNNYDILVELLAVVLSALAAWWSKRSNQQLKPNQAKVKHAAHSRQNNLNGNEISISDLVTGLLEEMNRVHDRLDHIDASTRGPDK